MSARKQTLVDMLAAYGKMPTAWGRDHSQDEIAQAAADFISLVLAARNIDFGKTDFGAVHDDDIEDLVSALKPFEGIK
jgi:hypothetical protein